MLSIVVLNKFYCYLLLFYCFSIMGHGEEDGIIPRFSEELFSRIENVEDKTVSNRNIKIY